MAHRHDEILAAGGRVVGISIDSPQQHSALIDKLDLPFPLLSDPDRSQVITPWGLANPTDKRNIAVPAVVVIAPTGNEVYREVSRDFADRLDEDELIHAVRELRLPATSQERPRTVDAEPGPHAMPERALLPYWRGARFAAVAFGMRHSAAKEDADLFVEQMDRFSGALKARRESS